MMMPIAMEHKIVMTLEQSLLIRRFLMILEMRRAIYRLFQNIFIIFIKNLHTHHKLYEEESGVFGMVKIKFLEVKL